MTTVWITGATGLIGRPLVERLRRGKAPMVLLSRSARAVFPDIGGAIDVDLGRDDLAALPRPDGRVVLICLASQITTSSSAADLPGILKVDAAAHLRLIAHLHESLDAIVYASSCTVYGWPETLPVDERAAIRPENVYALNKVAMEAFLGLTAAHMNVPVAVLRIAQVYGPGAGRQSALYSFLARAHAGEAPLIAADPTTVRDYCYVGDVVEAILLSVAARANATMNIGGGDCRSLHELARLCVEIAGSSVPPRIEAAPRRRQNMCLDCSAARERIGYQPAVSLRRGVEMEYRRLFGA